MEALETFFADWGYWGMLLGAFLAGSIVPIGSEVLLILLLKLGLNPVLLILYATVGNTLGGVTCYWIGMLGKMEWIHKWLGVSEEKLAKAHKFLEGRGAFMALFSFMPYIGEAIIVVLGLMRSNFTITTLSMALGKALRYIATALIFFGVLRL